MIRQYNQWHSAFYIAFSFSFAAAMGFAVGFQDPRLRILAIVIAALPTLAIASLHLPSLVLGFAVFLSIFADNFSGSPLSFSPLTGVPIPLGDVLLIVLALSIASLRLMSNSPLRSPIFISGWILWLALMFIALVGAPYTGSALRYFIQIGLVPFAIALFLMNLPWRPDRFFQIARLLTAVATIVACIAVVEQLTGINLFSTSRRDAYLEAVNHFQVGDLTRAGGVFGQPDWLGGYITLFIAFPIGFAIATRNPFSRLGWISSEMFLLSALLASGTRLALLGSAVSLLAFVILGSRFRAISRPVLFLCITAIITVGSLVLVSPDVEPLNRLNVVSTRLSSTDERDVGIRLGAAVTGLRVAAMHPVQGIGLDYERYMDASIGVMDPRQIRPLAQPHNSYIELAAFAGYPALLAIVLLITRYTSGLWRGLKTPECVDPIRIALFSSVIGFLFSNMLVNLLTLPAISYCFWALLVSSTLPRFRENTHFPDTQSSRF